ncbi:MAG: MFS transporter [Tetrasphaera sp.]
MSSPARPTPSQPPPVQPTPSQPTPLRHVPSRPTPLRHNRVARTHLTGVWANCLGGGVFDIALPLIVLLSTGSLAQMATIAIAQQVPKALPGLVVGGIVDRQPPRRMMLLGYLGQALVVAVIPVAMLLGIHSLVLLVAVAYVRGSLDMFARTATFVAIPEMYGEDTPAFNAALSTAWTSAAIIGPAVGGVLATTIPPELLLTVDAASFLVMAYVVTRLPVPRSAPARAGASSLAASLRAGYGYLLRMQGFGWFVATVVCVGCVYAPLGTLSLYTVSTVYHASSTVVGLVSSAAAFGLFTGSLVAHRQATTAPRTIMLRGSAVMTLGALLFFVPHWGAVAAGIYVVCAGGVYWTVGRTTTMHTQVPKEHLGKSMTAIQFLETFIGPASVVTAASVAERVGPRAAYGLVVGASALSGLFMLAARALLEAPRLSRLVPVVDGGVVEGEAA